MLLTESLIAVNTIPVMLGSAICRQHHIYVDEKCNEKKNTLTTSCKHRNTLHQEVFETLYQIKRENESLLSPEKISLDALNSRKRERERERERERD